VTIAERLYRLIGKPYPEQWDSMEQSARTFTDQFAVKWLAENDPKLKSAVTEQRRRKLAARALLSGSEILLALLPSNKVAAFCVQLASLTAAQPA
jgi:hypothetical protein